MNEQEKEALAEAEQFARLAGIVYVTAFTEAINSTVDQGLALGNTDEFGVSRRVQDAVKFIAQEAVRRMPAQLPPGAAP